MSGTMRTTPGRPSPELVRRGERLVACPRAAEGERTGIDVAQLIEEERDRWPLTEADWRSPIVQRLPFESL